MNIIILEPTHFVDKDSTRFREIPHEISRKSPTTSRKFGPRHPKKNPKKRSNFPFSTSFRHFRPVHHFWPVFDRSAIFDKYAIFDNFTKDFRELKVPSFIFSKVPSFIFSPHGFFVFIT